MKEAVTGVSDSTENDPAEEKMAKELENDGGNTSEPKDIGTTIVTSEGENSKTSKKVPFYLL